MYRGVVDEVDGNSAAVHSVDVAAVASDILSTKTRKLAVNERYVLYIYVKISTMHRVLR